MKIQGNPYKTICYIKGLEYTLVNDYISIIQKYTAYDDYVRVLDNERPVI